MAYTEITNRNSPNYTKGRGGKKVSGITIHWWGDPKQNPTFEGVVNWLCNPASQVSAHYVITGTSRRAACLVNEADTAWHAGTFAANQTTIGLELDPRCRAEDYDVAAEVIADLWRFYGKLPLYPHKHWVATACPGNYDLNKLRQLAETKLNPPKPPTTPAPTWSALSGTPTLRAKVNTPVIDLTTKKATGSPVLAGTDTKFVEKKTQDGKTWYRSEWSKNNNKNWGVNSADLMEVPKPPTPPKPEEPQPPVIEQPDYPKENNALLKQILALLQGLVEKITGIFK